MDKKIWEVLGIEETKDEEKIIQAYRDKLIAVNPEDDAKGFMQLRAAYEEALRFVNEPEQEEIRQEKNDVDLWIDKIAGIYSSLDSRRDEKAWEELFKDDICIGLDTSIEAREKLLVFLMDHYYLPHRIWKLMDREFDIVADKEDLYEIFPRNFIDYVVNQITVEGFLDFTLFDYKEGEEADEYIRTYFQLKSSLDEDKLDDCQKIID
ncbi:MAG: J domain-containing protein, partial [Bacillota bacterium]|nr:J domain-containing protein [Bacillota bacterium]